MLLPESYARAKIKALHGVKSCALNEKSIDKKVLLLRQSLPFSGISWRFLSKNRLVVQADKHRMGELCDKGRGVS